MSTTVSRRMVMVKMKKTNKPHVPLPSKAPSSGSSKSESAGTASAAPLVRRPAPVPAWRKTLKPAGIAFGLLACGAIAYGVMNSPTRPAYDRSAEMASVQMSSPASPRRASSPPQTASAAMHEPVVLSQRTGATDESFRATGYVRKKVYLPNADGDCVVRSGLDRVAGNCLSDRD